MSRIISIRNAAMDLHNSEDITLTVACHNGKFHLDEIMALVWLTLAGINFTVVRTRDPKIIEAQDLAIDVGGRNEGRFFDHHQRDFDRVRDNGVHWAACGLVWNDLKDIILDEMCPENENVRHTVRTKIEENLVIPTDAVDTGTTGPQNPLTPPSLAAVVGAYNTQDPNAQDDSFWQCYRIILDIVEHMLHNWIAAAIEQDRILTQMLEQSESDILVIEEGGPWIELAVKNWNEFSHFQVAVYPDITNPDQWRIQSFPGSQTDTFQQRCSAPAVWKGLKAGDDYGTTFDDKMVFCHPAGFIAGVRGTRDDAIVAASYWIQNHS